MFWCPFRNVFSIEKEQNLGGLSYTEIETGITTGNIADDALLSETEEP